MPYLQIHIEANRQFEVTIQRATTVVNVTVTRNEFEPRFTQGEYRREAMNEKTAVGTKILTVSASDKDGVSCIQRDPPSEYFDFLEHVCIILLKQSSCFFSIHYKI